MNVHRRREEAILANTQEEAVRQEEVVRREVVHREVIHREEAVRRGREKAVRQ